MEKRCFLHISDIHVGDLAVSNELKPVVKDDRHSLSILESLIDIIKENNPEFIFVTGDITSRAKPEEFSHFQKVINMIAQECEIEHQKIVILYGNHDINWAIYEMKPDSKFDTDYLKVAGSVGTPFINNQFNTIGPVPNSGTIIYDDITVFCLNSGYYSVPDDTAGKLGQEQLEWLEKELSEEKDPSRTYIALLHHHPVQYRYPIPTPDHSILDEGPELLELFGKFGIDIVCHGHRHHSRVETKYENAWKAPITFTSVGSMSVKPDERNYGTIPLMFHIVEISKKTKDGNAFGAVKAFKHSPSMGWKKAEKDGVEVPIDHLNYFGYCVTLSEREEIIDKIIASQKGKDRIKIPLRENITDELKVLSKEDFKELLESRCPQGYELFLNENTNTYLKN